jgi:hypothetical protein
LLKITFQNGMLAFSVKSLRLSYSGTLKDNDSKFEGFWKQGQSYPLAFRRALHPSMRTTVLKDAEVRAGPSRSTGTQVAEIATFRHSCRSRFETQSCARHSARLSARKMHLNKS